ncbi:sensor histidine kinase [Clostridium uliginosum]|uniref:histidine kinase n=1 Tax=Clostridium uliginosum TaxID=119641 RepID=A0A1I1R2C3_9CLOT|nr:HAMP domain-containing sensor histidine kinase [Clostridium uliginosum]SFD28465.1 Signal transduction histidine kinase [Clostridium uliginosum]
MDIKKQIKLRTIFIKYLFMFCISTIVIMLALLILYSIIFSSINVLPANYAENKLMEQKNEISSSKNVTPSLIPDTCKYGVYTNDGKIISGNLNPKEATKAWDAVKNSEKGSNFLHHYLKIPRENEVCIVQYSISSQYTSPTLRKFLPNPDLFLIFLFCFGFILEGFFLAYNFGKKFTKNMELLQDAAKKIQNENLDFSIKYSGIFEIDNVLSSMDEMKEALKTSMKKQWDLEQERRKQISSLAHDIKTPLTIVRGNAELLEETNQTDEQKEYTNYIIDSAHDMQQYIKALIEISKADIGYILQKEELDSKKYLDIIYNHINALTSIKKIKVDLKINNLPKVFKADFNLLQRAIMNVVSNAVDYSKENGTIIFSVDQISNYIRFTICDDGNGFSKEALLNAKQQFYMGDLSRSSKSHYGMGLYIADSIVKQHNGKMELTNSNVTKGAEINIYIPI